METEGKDIGTGLNQEMLTLAHWVRGASEIGVTRGRLETTKHRCSLCQVRSEVLGRSGLQVKGTRQRTTLAVMGLEIWNDESQRIEEI